MDRIWRRGLIWLLAITLIVGGMPLVHATPCASEPAPSGSIHHGMQMDVAAGHDHHQHEMQTDRASLTQTEHGDPTHGIVDLCTCLNCNMCTTPAVAAGCAKLQPELRSFAVSYTSATSAGRSALVFVDPGIPIRLM